MPATEVRGLGAPESADRGLAARAVLTPVWPHPAALRYAALTVYVPAKAALPADGGQQAVAWLDLVLNGR